MGKRGMGPFLELGPEGDMGSGDMVMLHVIYTSETYGTNITQRTLPVADILLHLSADVLVGSELSPVSPG